MWRRMGDEQLLVVGVPWRRGAFIPKRLLIHTQYLTS